MSRIGIGCKGLNHANWLTDYYPEDLPPEWRLSFYANDFSVLLLPPSEWQDLERLEGQLEEFDGQLRIYCQIEHDWPEESTAHHLKQMLGDNFAGWVSCSVQGYPEYISTDDQVNSSDSGLRYCAELDESQQSPVEVFILRDACSMAEARRLLELSAVNFMPDSAFVLITDKPQIEFMQQFRTLLEIMAIA